MTEMEKNLLQQAVAGNPGAFRELLDLHYMTVYRMAFKLCGTKHDAEDVTQMACMKIARNIHGFRLESEFTTWLYTIVLNTVRDWRRSQARHRSVDIDETPEIEAESQTPEQSLATRQQMEKLRALPEPEREIVFLVFGEGLSHKQAAQIMGCAESTISWRIHEARKILTRQGGR